MSTEISSQVVGEIKSAIQQLETYGFHLESTEGEGMMFWAVFKRAELALTLVKDRGYWWVICGESGRQAQPSRKSQAAAIKDALSWIRKMNA